MMLRLVHLREVGRFLCLLEVLELRVQVLQVPVWRVVLPPELPEWPEPLPPTPLLPELLPQGLSVPVLPQGPRLPPEVFRGLAVFPVLELLRYLRRS